ncbi:MAG: pyridoxamine 5'-phosphate oxidase [Chloroflexi bacterium]|nr:pyridoxamine 5'-phosphate oxidase [Chloroflexota bacterium]MDA1240384.1 pyridoxamine 5'-phosphate oxidase [Chloroflexota bacterium]
MIPFPHPLIHFDEWYATARAAEPQPDAASLATLGTDGQPENRTVLVPRWSSRGFEFYTDRGSRKGQALAAHPRAALSWLWKGAGRQVRAEGLVVPTSEAESDACWASSARESQLSAAASMQSQPGESRAALIAGLRELEAEYLGREVPRPARWGGYRLVPLRIEFWHDNEFHLNDRLEYARASTTSPWRTRTLQP